jgi:hypothetical protein
MSKPKITTEFSRYSDPDLLAKVDEIYDSLTSNLNFPTPTPALIIVNTLASDFRLCLTNAASHDKVDVSIKNQKRELLESTLINLGLYVQANGKDDESILLSSGYDLQKPKAPIGLLDKPEN